MKMRTRLSLLAATLVVALPGSASAAGDQIAPNFDRAEGYANCSSGVPFVQLPNGCTATASTLVDGTLDLDLMATTPLQGRAPGPSSAYGDLYLSLSRPIPAVPARLFLFTVTAHINKASATDGGRQLSARGYGSLSAYADVSLEEAGRYDSDGEYRDLVDISGDWAPSSIEDQDIVFTLVVGGGQSHVHDGSIRLTFGVSGYASAGGSVSTSGLPRGSVRVSLDAAVTSVTVEAVA